MPGNNTTSVGGLTLNTGATVALTNIGSSGARGLLQTPTVTFAAPSSKLDLGTNGLLVNESLSALRSQIFNSNIITTAAGLGVGSKDQGGGVVEAVVTLKGDANLDGTVDVGDLGALATNYGVSGGETWINGDFNYDNNVDVADLGALATNYNLSIGNGGAGAAFGAGELASPTAAAVAASAASVPEPSALALIAAGAVGMLSRRRRRRLAR